MVVNDDNGRCDPKSGTRCRLLLEAARTHEIRTRCFIKQSASARDAQDQKHIGPRPRGGRAVLRDQPTYGNAHRLGLGWPEVLEAVHRSSHQSPAGCCLLLRGSAMWIETSSPTARWLPFVVKGFSNSGSRRMRLTPSRSEVCAHLQFSSTYQSMAGTLGLGSMSDQGAQLEGPFALKKAGPPGTDQQRPPNSVLLT